MKEINMKELEKLLSHPLETEGMKASEIMLLKSNLFVPHGRGFKMKQIEEYQKHLRGIGLPEGRLYLPIQYATGEYEFDDEKKPLIYQDIATVFHPDFYEGKTLMDDDSPWRPLTGGYLDVEHPEYNADEDQYERAFEYNGSLWIGNQDVNNAKGLIDKHLSDFSRLYKINEFLKKPEGDLVRKSFEPY